MAITLDGVTLNPNLQWIDRYEDTPIAQTAQRTLGGSLIVHSQGLTEGRPVTLQATEETGWFTYAEVAALRARAKVVNGQYTLDFHGEIMTVMFRHQEPPVLSFQSILYKEPLANDDYLTGTVKLFTL